MPGLKEIGNGVQVADFTGQDPVEAVQKQLGLVDLVNRIKAAPIEQAAKEADLRLKQNEVDQININNALKEQQLQSAVYGEQRQQIKFRNEILNQLGENIRIGGAQLGDFSIKQAFGTGAAVIDKGDGIAVASIPGYGAIPINTGTTNPKELNSMTEDRQTRWTKLSERYSEVYKSTKQIEKQMGLATASGDIASIYLRAKQLDPGGRVTEGDYNSVINSPNVPTYLKNMLKRALSQDSPFFGDKDSTTRKQFLQSSNLLLQQEKDVFEPQAKFFLNGMVVKDKLDPEKIMVPAGDIDLNYLGYKPKSESGLTSELSQSIQEPYSGRDKASSAETKKASNVASEDTVNKKNPAKTLDDLTTDWFNQTFTGGKR